MKLKFHRHVFFKIGKYIQEGGGNLQPETYFEGWVAKHLFLNRLFLRNRGIVLKKERVSLALGHPSLIIYQIKSLQLF